MSYTSNQENSYTLKRIADIYGMRELPAQGHNGLFDSASKGIYVNVGYNISDYEACMIFMHELGHRIDYMEDPGAFVLKEKEEKELYANNYATANYQRCSGLNTIPKRLIK